MGSVSAPSWDTAPDHYVKAWHNILRAHCMTVQVLRRIPVAKIGIAPTVSPYIPQTEKDVDACRESLFRVQRIVDGKPEDALRNFVNVPSMLLDHHRI